MVNLYNLMKAQSLLFYDSLIFFLTNLDYFMTAH